MLDRFFPGLALVEFSVVEQRYRAVLAVECGDPTIVVRTQFGSGYRARPCILG